jgi:hypothetical protein
MNGFLGANKERASQHERFAERVAAVTNLRRGLGSEARSGG